MRLVLDTNVLVSALLHPGRTPDLALAAARSSGAVMLIDERIEAEYRAVLARPKLAIDPARRDALLDALFASAERVSSVAPYEGPMIDEDDRVFVEVAIAGRADAIVTGNAKHYAQCHIDVLAPAALLSRLEAG